MTPKKKEVSSMGENLYKEMKIVAKKFVSQREGAELYSMGLNTFRNLANDAGAVYKVGVTRHFIVDRKSILFSTV